MRDWCWFAVALTFYGAMVMLSAVAIGWLLMQPAPLAWFAALPAIMLVWALVDVSGIISDA